jgi:hypothetical protein
LLELGRIELSRGYGRVELSLNPRMIQCHLAKSVLADFISNRGVESQMHGT